MGILIWLTKKEEQLKKEIETHQLTLIELEQTYQQLEYKIGFLEKDLRAIYKLKQKHKSSQGKVNDNK